MTLDLLLDEDALLDELARRHLLDFTVRTFLDGDAFDVNWHHVVVAEQLERWAFGDTESAVPSSLTDSRSLDSPSSISTAPICASMEPTVMPETMVAMDAVPSPLSTPLTGRLVPSESLSV